MAISKRKQNHQSSSKDSGKTPNVERVDANIVCLFKGGHSGKYGLETSIFEKFSSN